MKYGLLQNSKSLKIEDKLSTTSVIIQCVRYKKWPVIQFNLQIEYLWKDTDFCVLLKIWAKILVKTSWSYKKSVTDAVETASKRVIQETRDANGDLVASKIANKVAKCLPQNNLETDSQTEEKSIEQ